MSISELIEKLEKAESGDRFLDAAIAVATFETISADEDLIYAKAVVPSDKCTPGTFWRVSRSGMSLRTSERYTSSVDSALSLVPEGWAYQILHTSSLPYVSGKTHSAHIKAMSEYGWHDTPNWTGDAYSAPLAICLAALKARFALQEGEK